MFARLLFDLWAAARSFCDVWFVASPGACTSQTKQEGMIGCVVDVCAVDVRHVLLIYLRAAASFVVVAGLLVFSPDVCRVRASVHKPDTALFNLSEGCC